MNRLTLTLFLLTLPACDSPAVFQHQVIRVTEFTINRHRVYEASDISAITRISSESVLIAADEGASAQLCTISHARRQITAGPLLQLLPDPDTEADLEAACTIADTCYLTGSHGLAKKTAQYQPDRHKCFRFTADPRTGRKTGPVRTATLAPILQSDPALGPHYRKPLQHRGINIEGLAAKNGRLYFGLRSPNLGGNAFVIETDPNNLFADPDKTDYTLHRIPLGPGLGIRSIAPTNTGFLIIAGNAGSEPGDLPQTRGDIKDFDPRRGYYLFFWPGDQTVHRIGEIPRTDDDYKAEAMLVLDENESTVDVLILFDGPDGGAPTLYRLTKTAAQHH